MRAISAAQHCSVVSLLNEGYSHRQIQVRTGLGKGTVGRISKEVENNGKIIKKITLLAVLPSFLQGIKQQSFWKFTLEGWIMLFRPHNS